MARMAVQISKELVEQAKLLAKVERRSIAKQIEHWAMLGKCAEENPDLPMDFIKGIFLGLEQAKQGMLEEFKPRKRS